jgi:hypothetical protein
MFISITIFFMGHSTGGNHNKFQRPAYQLFRMLLLFFINKVLISGAVEINNE